MCGLPQGLKNVRSPPYGELSAGRPCVGPQASHRTDRVNNNWTWRDGVVFFGTLFGRDIIS